MMWPYFSKGYVWYTNRLRNVILIPLGVTFKRMYAKPNRISF